MKYQLLCTFSTAHKLESTLKIITDTYSLAKKYIYVLCNELDNREIYITYNINPKTIIIDNTISIHRKPDTNTIYTINALNHLIRLQNNGILDATFSIEWNQYRNCIILLNGDEIKKIPTLIYKVIEI